RQGESGAKRIARRKQEPLQHGPRKTNAGSKRKAVIMENSKFIGGLAALSLALPLIVATGHAQNTAQQPSAKVTAKVSNRTLLGPIEAANGTSADSGWVTILCNNIKTANLKDLFITA